MKSKVLYMKKLQSFFMLSAILFVLSIHTTHAQTENDTIVASRYFKKAGTFLTDRKLDSAVVYFNKALPIYQNAKAWERVARSYNKISESQWRNDKYEASLKKAKKALEISNVYLGRNSLEEASAYNNIGVVLHIKREYSNSIKYYKKTLTIREKGLGFYHLETGYTYLYLGMAYHRSEEYKMALTYYEKAFCIMINELDENHLDIALCNFAIGDLYMKKGEYNEAIPYLKKRLSVLKYIHGEEHNGVVDTFNKIGLIFKNKGDYNRALYYYNRAIDIRNKLPEYSKKRTTPAMYNNIGIVFKYKGAYDKALKYLKNGLNLNLKINGENYRYVALNYKNIGNLYRLKGDYKQSLWYYDKALRIRIKLFDKNNSHIADSYNDIGELYMYKKDYEKALHHTNKALLIRQKIYGENNPFVADSYTNLGSIYGNQKEYILAIEIYQKALVIRQSVFGEQHPKVAVSHNHIADVYAMQKDLKNSIKYYNKAIAANTILNTVIDPKIFHPEQYLNPNILLASLGCKAKNYINLFQKSQDIKNLKETIETYQKADIVIQHIRQTFTTYQDKVAFAKKAKEVYHGAIQAQLLLYRSQKEQQTLEKAFYYAEKSKANTLKELLTDANAKNFTGLPTDLVTLEKELRIDGAFYQSQIIKERSDQKVDTTKITGYENKLFDIGRRKDSLITVLEKNYPKYYQLKHENRIISVTDIQKNINAHTTVLEFFTSDSSTYAFAISKDKIALQILSTPNLSHNVEKLRTAITSKDLAAYKKLGYDLYNQLLAPIAEQLVGDQLIIIPDGPLWHCNFEVLLTQKDASNNPVALSYVLRGYAISYANSANLLFGSHKKQNPIQKQECLAFSFSDSTQIAESKTMSMATLRGAGDDLPGTRKEIKAISNIINGQYYYGSQAIEANFKKNAGQYNILHLALHGDVDNERPENSKLYFTKSKDTIEDNLLYSHELFALNIPAELTVLSACNTGAGKIATGEGIMSLGTAFQYAGTKSLLLTSWEVSDQTTPDLMQYFYTNLKAGMHKAKALQQAKLQYLSTANINRTQPFYWAGFYLVGDTAPIPFENNMLLYWILGVLIMLLLGGLFWYRRKRK